MRRVHVNVTHPPSIPGQQTPAIIPKGRTRAIPWPAKEATPTAAGDRPGARDGPSQRALSAPRADIRGVERGAPPPGADAAITSAPGRTDSPARGSTSATFGLVPVIPQKELRNNVAEVLRRAEAGEEFTITVAGRPVAQLGPARRRQWVSGPDLAKVWRTPAPRTLTSDLEQFPGELADPFA